MPRTGGSDAEAEVLASLDEPPPRAEESTLLLRVEVVGVRAAEEATAEGAAPEAAVLLTTGFTSTVLPAAALLRLVRRRGVGEGVAIRGKSWKRNGNGGGERLPIRPDSSGR